MYTHAVSITFVNGVSIEKTIFNLFSFHEPTTHGKTLLRSLRERGGFVVLGKNGSKVHVKIKSSIQ